MKTHPTLFAPGSPKRKRRGVSFTPSETDRAEAATALENARGREAASREVAVSLPALADWEILAVTRLMVALLRA